MPEAVKSRQRKSLPQAPSKTKKDSAVLIALKKALGGVKSVRKADLLAIIAAEEQDDSEDEEEVDWSNLLVMRAAKEAPASKSDSSPLCLMILQTWRRHHGLRTA